MGNTTSYRKDFGLIVVGAVLFTVAFLWKDLITDIENLYFPKTRGIMNRIIFVLAATIVLVFIASQLRNYFGLTNNGQQPVQFDGDVPGDDSDLAVSLSNGIGLDNGGE